MLGLVGNSCMKTLQSHRLPCWFAAATFTVPACLQVELHAETVELNLPFSIGGQHQQALRLARTALRPKSLTIKPWARQIPGSYDMGEGLAVPELASTLAHVKEVDAWLPCSQYLASVSG
jgi:hypothetical protein